MVKFHWIKNAFFALLITFFAASSVRADGHFEPVHFQYAPVASVSETFFQPELFNAVVVRSDRLIRGLQVNFEPSGHYWEEVEFHDDGFGFERIVFTAPSHQVQLRMLGANPDDLKGISIDFIDAVDVQQVAEADGSSVVASTSSQGGLRVVTRAQWGADETLRYWNPDSDDGGSDGSSSSFNPCGDFSNVSASETALLRTVNTAPTGEFLTWPLQYTKNVQKIFVHHTDSDLRDLNGDRVLDGSDYKAMVRAIYRFHTVSRGWGDIGYNYIIDPLGNIYEGRYGGDRVVGAHAQCYNNGGLGIAIIGNYENNSVPDPALQSLIQLIAVKSATHNINPDGTSVFRGELTPNVMGHRDVRPTACPGQKLYGLLETIRSRASLTLRTGNFNESDLDIEPVDFDAEWVGSYNPPLISPGQRKTVQLQFKNTGKKTWDQNTWLYVYNNWNYHSRVVPVIADKKFVAADMNQASVRPGEVATFSVQLEAGYVADQYSFSVAPVVNGQYRIAKAQQPVTFSVSQPSFSYEVARSDLPSGKVFQGQKVLGSIELKNTGNVKWVNYGDNPIRLGTDRVRDRRSVLLKTRPTRLAYLKQSEVLPGQTGTFLFELTVPYQTTGRVTEYFTPVIEGVRWLDSKNLSFTVDLAKPVHKAVWTDRINTLTLQPGERFPVDLTLKNEGDVAWTPETFRAYFSTQGLTIFKEEWSPTESVNPGRSTATRFWVQAPYQSGTYSLAISSRYNHVPVPGGGGRFVVSVPTARVMARMAEQSDRAVKLAMNDTKFLEVKMKNTGSVVWHKRGNNAIYLAPARPQDRKSAFYDDSWPNRFRAALMAEDEVKPGETATFRFRIRPEKVGTYQEYFQLVIENAGWVPNSFVRWDITVSAATTSRSSNSSSNDEIRYYRTPRNLNNSSSSSSGTSSTTVTPVSTRSNYTETPVEVAAPTSSASSTTSAHNTMRDFRVLLSYEDDFSTVRVNRSYRITDLNSTTLFSVGTGTPVTLRHIAGDVHVELGGVVKTASEGVRILPDDDGVVEIVSMERRPSWNDSLNDNRFRGKLEIRSVDGKIAFINELPLEDYLKGLAEVSNGTPTEKQKAIAVLARTYAQFYMDDAHRKFPGKPYDGSDDPAVFQRYLGYGYEIRSPQFAQSVRATRGKVVTYQGKLVKTPYFSQSNGRTKSAEEVWGWTDTPYLKSVDDPYCAGKSQQGHGVGLSGCGSDGMARAGKTYEEIINYYYQGVSVQTF